MTTLTPRGVDFNDSDESTDSVAGRTPKNKRVVNFGTARKDG